MPEVQEVCEDVIASAEGSLACAVVDLTTGSTVGAAYGPDTELNANRIGLVSVAVTDMFRGRLIRQFHRAWSSGNSVPEHFVREVQMATANSYQFISVVPDRMDTLFVLITDRTVSLGLGWMSVHQALEQLENVAGPVGVGAASARHDSAAAKPPADASPMLRQPPPAAPETAPGPAGRGARRPLASEAPPSSVRASEPRAAPPPPMDMDPPPPAAKQQPPPAAASPPEPDPAPQAPPAAHSQRTYRGVPIDEAPASQGRPEGDVAMGPRGRMFISRRGPDRPKH